MVPPRSGSRTPLWGGSDTTAPTGNLGRNARAASGFDIYSFLGGGESKRNVAYAALSNGDRSTLYVVDLLDGSLNSMGKFASGRGEIVGLALPLNQDRSTASPLGPHVSAGYT